MKQAHSITLKVFVKEGEDYGKIKEAFLSFLPFELEKEKIKINEISAKGFEEKKIIILESILTKERHTNKFLESLLEKLESGEKQRILLLKEPRLDENADFFLRFEKNELLENRKLALTDSGNCFHIKISIAAFPKSGENALKAVQGIFS
ncbi:hypothetical protein J4212_05045 [Candidatus Woesearchaeota archaeon]|nr:hypothetical protein [Candidatus Woesearchaeota archaeon]